MNQINDLKLIKKYYGENMMHLCRTLFPTILETPGKLFSLLEEKFAYSKFLYDDIVDNSLVENFKNYIYSLTNEKKEEVIREEDPFTLLKEAGYNLYECKNETEIQSFKKYYKANEAICTFNGNRLSHCHVFFAVKENVDQIRREDFLIPHRQDKYGTSVISIQFTRGDVNTLSIKNRYNHVVDNPDATFSNNLENIIEGLTKSFERSYNLNINQNDSRSFELPHYVLANDGKYYKYNYEINNVYYCPNNIIIDHFIVRNPEKEKYIIADYFIIDLVNKKIKLYDDNIRDSFIDGLQDIEKIEVIRDKQTGEKSIDITLKDGKKAFIKLDKFNRIIKYINNNLVNVGYGFLHLNISLQEIELNNLEIVDDRFLMENRGLRKINFPKLVKAGTNFVSANDLITSANLPMLEEVGIFFLMAAQLNEINVPMLKKAGMGFLYYNNSLDKISFESMKEVGDNFMYYNSRAKVINMPKLIIAGKSFCGQSQCTELYLPSVETIGEDSLLFNTKLSGTLVLENLKYMGDRLLYLNTLIDEVKIPNLISRGSGFLGDRYLVPKGK